MTQRLRIAGLAMILVLIVSKALFAQSGGGISLMPNVLSSGGITSSSGGATSLGGTLGQFGAGPSDGGTVDHNGGFWQEAGDTTLAVTLSYFSAETDGDMIDFTWQTATESGTAGFNILAEIEGESKLLNPEMIPSSVVDALTTTSYSYRVATGATRFYLDELHIDGGATRHGPFDLGVPHGSPAAESSDLLPAIYLPLVAGE